MTDMLIHDQRSNLIFITVSGPGLKSIPQNKFKMTQRSIDLTVLNESHFKYDDRFNHIIHQHYFFIDFFLKRL